MLDGRGASLATLHATMIRRELRVSLAERTAAALVTQSSLREAVSEGPTNTATIEKYGTYIVRADIDAPCGADQRYAFGQLEDGRDVRLERASHATARVDRAQRATERE